MRSTISAEPTFRVRVDAVEWGPRLPRVPGGFRSVEDQQQFSAAIAAHIEAQAAYPRPRHCLDIPERPAIHLRHEEDAEDPVTRAEGLAEVAKRNRKTMRKKGNLAGEPWFVLVQVEDEEMECECMGVTLGPDGVGAEKWYSTYHFRVVHPTAQELARMA